MSTTQQLEALIGRLESAASQNHKAYQVRLLLLAALGYAYIAGVVILVLLALAGSGYLLSQGRGILAIKLGIPLIILLSLILRALWVRIAPPQGLLLQRSDSKVLWDEVDRIGVALDSPGVHRILITDDFNAGVSQVPRLGVLGWQRNYLVIGLPLMSALSTEQFRGVLAHEFAHLSRSHARFAAWVYRVRRTWFHLLEALERSDHWGAILFLPFFDWYAPYFGAYSFVLARADEYEADRLAAQLVGVSAMADALVSIAIRGRFLSQQFWPQLLMRADHEPVVPADALAVMLDEVRRTPVADSANRWLAESLGKRTGTQDTHPALADRLRALEVSFEDYRERAIQALTSTADHSETAASHLLGDAVPRLAARLDANWRASIESWWQARYAFVAKSRRTLRELQDKALNDSLAPAEAWERTRLTFELESRDAVIPLLRDLVAEQPNHPQAVFWLGQFLIEQGNEEGIALLERDMANDPAAVIPGCRLISEWMISRGRAEESQRYEARARQQAEILEKAELERSLVTSSDTFTPHGLPASEIRVLRAHLPAYPRVKSAYLVRKVVQHFPERPFHVLGVAPRSRWNPFASDVPDHVLTRDLASHLPLPLGTLVILLEGLSRRSLRGALKKVDGAEIYRRTR